jgi:hypothetical protein
MQQKPQDVIRNRIMQELTETVQQHPGVQVPKKDKILEWTLYNIFEQLQGINICLNGIAAHLRMGQH